MPLGEKESLLVATVALLVVAVMLLWGVWYVLGIASKHLQERYPWLRTATFSLAVIALFIWFVATYRDALVQFLKMLR